MSAVVEVCMISYASGDDLVGAMRSIASHLPGAAVAIQENAESAESLEHLALAAAGHGLAFRSRHDPSNPGFGAACNALALTSEASWLLFLNPDAEITAWPFTAEPSPRAILGPQAVSGRSPESHRGVRYTVVDELRRSWLRRYGPAPEGRGFVSGAALLIHRDDFARLGGFDERFFLYYEDIELCLRANALGVDTRLVPGWTVAHRGAHSTSSRFAMSLVWSYESGMRFHHMQGGSTAMYRAYVTADAALRWTAHLVRRDVIRRQAYAHLARRAAGDLFHRRGVR